MYTVYFNCSICLAKCVCCRPGLSSLFTAHVSAKGVVACGCNLVTGFWVGACGAIVCRSHKETVCAAVRALVHTLGAPFDIRAIGGKAGCRGGAVR